MKIYKIRSSFKKESFTHPMALTCLWIQETKLKAQNDMSLKVAK